MNKAFDGRVLKIVAASTIFFAVILRFFIRTSFTLWEDEVIAATHAMQSTLQVITSVIVNDIHPPLYFLELHFWSLLSHADIWLIVNSIMFSILAIASMLIVTRKICDTNTGLITAAVFSALPVTLWMSGEVRMYAMLSVLLIWMHYFNYLVFVLQKKRKEYLIATFILALAIIYTHAIGFIAVFFFGVYGASFLVTRRATAKEWRQWLALFGIAGLCSLPLLIGTYFHIADMPQLTGFKDIVSWMSAILIGEGYKSASWLQISGCIAYLIIAVFGLLLKQTRRLTLVFLIGPMLVCLVIGLLGKPLFKANFFSNFYSLFLALVAGQLVTAIPARGGRQTIMLICVIAALFTMGIANRIILNEANGYYRQISDIIEADKKPGDVVWAPQPSVFWGMVHYLAPNDRSSSLKIRPKLRAQSGWWKVFDRLGPTLTNKLDLIPSSQTITTQDGLRIVIGMDSHPKPEGKGRLWVVTFPRPDLAPSILEDRVRGWQEIRSLSSPPLEVSLYNEG